MGTSLQRGLLPHLGAPAIWGRAPGKAAATWMRVSAMDCCMTPTYADE